MKEKNGKLIYDIEHEYRTRKRSGEEMDIDTFLSIYELSKNGKRWLARRLQRWEKHMSGFDEYYKSIDFDAMFEDILKEVDKRIQIAGKRQPITVARILRMVEEAGQEVMYIIIPVPQLLPEGVGGPSRTRDIRGKGSEADTELFTEPPTRFTWSGDALDGMRLQVTPKNRILFEFPKDIKASMQIRFFDSEDHEVYPEATHPLDEYGRASYDFTGLPPGEYSVVVETPEGEQHLSGLDDNG